MITRWTTPAELAWPRIWSVLVLVLWAVSGVASVVHNLAWNHVACVEHGHVVHERPGSQVAVKLVEPESRLGARPELPPSADEHEHCDVPAVAAPGVALVATVCAQAPLLMAAHGGGGVQAAAAGLAPWRLLLAAPKTSPPV